MLPRLASLRRTALDLLFPCRCLGCDREGSLLCPSCRQKLPAITSSICPRCGMPQTNSVLCPACSSHKHDVDGIRSLFRFEGIIRQAIHQLKYKNLRAIVEPLAGLLGNYLTTHPIPGEALVPVPLHRRRLKERGYNQSELLARELGKIVKLPVIADCITRNKHTPAQARATSVGERRRNVANVFTCRNHSLQNKKIILIDDVATSGATLNACAATLKAAGAVSVWGLTIAREV
ncbi:MAG: ComF family protein [Chloroflexota bacterium]